MYMLLWISAIDESPGECLYTPNKLANIEKLKLYKHLPVNVDNYMGILVNCQNCMSNTQHYFC
jgi:hypothetical protein